MNEFILVHHGVKGQKWGVRRYQNPDGTLTKAGKRRLAKEEYEKDIEDAKNRLDKESKDEIKRSATTKWYKKHPDANPDEEEGWEGFPEDDPLYKSGMNKGYQSFTLGKYYVSNNAGLGGMISAMFAAPVASIIAAKATKGKIKNGLARTGVILGSGIGAITIGNLIGRSKAKKEQNKTIRELGIKSVKQHLV